MAGGPWARSIVIIKSVIRLVTIVLVIYNSKEEKEETGEIEGQAQHYKLTELHMDKPPACLEFFNKKKISKVVGESNIEIALKKVK